MLIDWVNCLLEFSAVLVLFLTLVTFIPQRREIIIYYILSILSSFLFVFIGTPLLFNISLFLIIPSLSFHKKSKENMILMTVSIMSVFYLEFMCYSLLPVFLLQTNVGHLIANILIYAFLFFVYLFSFKMKYNKVLNPLLLRHKVSVITILLFMCLLSQSYLSRLSLFWTYLPGAISVALFLVVFFTLCIYIHYARSTDHLQIQMLTTHLDDIEAIILSLRLQNHDYQHHIRNFRNQVNTASNLEELRAEINTYIDQMKEDRTWFNSILSINQPVLRAVLYGCYTKCLQEGISFHFHSTDQIPNFPLKDYQLAELLENLTINAIEQNSVIPLSQREISLSFFAEDGHNEITISNPVTDSSLPLSDMLHTGTTSKDGATHQGLGLSSIQHICFTNNITFYGQRGDDAVSFSIAYEENRS